MLEVEAKEKTDIELYKDFLNGNKEAFNELMLRYQKQLKNFIIAYVKNKDIAEDLVQDTFLYVLINKKEYDFKYSLRTYLYTIAKCRAINYLNKIGRRNKINKEYFYENEYVDFDANIIKENNIEVIKRNMEKLKYEYKIVLLLRDFQNFEYKEICKILNKNIYQIKILIHRARKSLKKKIEMEGYNYDEWK